MNKAIFLLQKSLKKIAALAGYELKISKKISTSTHRSGMNLNVGCGKYFIDGFISLDIHTEHYHKNKNQPSSFIEYDLRKDSLPFEKGIIDNIYISHVIEHIETRFVENFIHESYRVLKPQGVLRIACPDAEFLYEVSCFENEYWAWRSGWFKGKNVDKKAFASLPSQMDFYIREVSTPRSKYYLNRLQALELDSIDIQGLAYKEILEKLTSDLEFRLDYPGDHINAWDYYRLKKIGEVAGFTQIIRSKPGGSVSLAMQGSDMDRTHPQMSLYIDMVK